MLSFGPDADLQHDGRAELRPRQLLHAGRLRGVLSVTQVVGFWWGAAVGAAASSVRHGVRVFERYALRRVHKFGHVPNCSITFGLSYLHVRGGAAGLGAAGAELRAARRHCKAPLFTIVQLLPAAVAGLGVGDAVRGDVQDASPTRSARSSRFRAFGMGVAMSDAGGGVAAAHAHAHRPGDPGRADAPEMAVEALGHNVPRVFMLVFGGGSALAALAGVIGGILRVTEPSMAGAVGCGGLRRHRHRRHGLAGRGLRRLRWRSALIESLPVGSDRVARRPLRHGSACRSRPDTRDSPCGA